MPQEIERARDSKRAEADLAYDIQKNKTSQALKKEEVQIAVIEKEQQIVVQEREIQRVGGNESVRVDVRVVVATLAVPIGVLLAPRATPESWWVLWWSLLAVGVLSTLYWLGTVLRRGGRCRPAPWRSADARWMCPTNSTLRTERCRAASETHTPSRRSRASPRHRSSLRRASWPSL